MIVGLLLSLCPENWDPAWQYPGKSPTCSCQAISIKSNHVVSTSHNLYRTSYLFSLYLENEVIWLNGCCLVFQPSSSGLSYQSYFLSDKDLLEIGLQLDTILLRHHLAFPRWTWRMETWLNGWLLDFPVKNLIPVLPLFWKRSFQNRLAIVDRYDFVIIAFRIVGRHNVSGRHRSLPKTSWAGENPVLRTY